MTPKGILSTLVSSFKYDTIRISGHSFTWGNDEFVLSSLIWDDRVLVSIEALTNAYRNTLELDAFDDDAAGQILDILLYEIGKRHVIY